MKLITVNHQPVNNPVNNITNANSAIPSGLNKKIIIVNNNNNSKSSSSSQNIITTSQTNSTSTSQNNQTNSPNLMKLINMSQLTPNGIVKQINNTNNLGTQQFSIKTNGIVSGSIAAAAQNGTVKPLIKINNLNSTENNTKLIGSNQLTNLTQQTSTQITTSNTIKPIITVQNSVSSQINDSINKANDSEK